MKKLRKRTISDQGSLEAFMATSSCSGQCNCSCGCIDYQDSYYLWNRHRTIPYMYNN